MHLFDTMLSTATEVKEQTKSRTTPLLHAHFDDIHTHDKDIVLNDMQAGDHWLWIIKGNGCGTYLVLLDGKADVGFVSRAQDKNAMVFMVRVTGENEGVLTRIENEDAAGYIDQALVSKNRVPRRLTMYSQLSMLMRLDKLGVRLSETKLWSDFSVNKGDLSTLTISNKGGQLSITIKRDVINLAEGVSSREAVINTTIKLGTNYDACEEYNAVYEIEATDSQHAIFKKVA